MNYQETGRLQTTAGAARNYFNSYSYFPLKTDDDDDEEGKKANLSLFLLNSL
jgi:hypothetical protein